MSESQLSARPAMVVDYGYTVISSGGSNPIVDVVFVHGLGGHPKKTWMSGEHRPKASAEPRPSKLAALGNKVNKLFRKNAKSSIKATSSSAAGRGGESGNEADSAAESEASVRAAISDPPTAKIFWPNDLLTTDFEDARLLTFGYASNPAYSTQNNLYTLSRSLLRRLASERENCPTRPLIFVCHSLGGILTKFALKLAQDSSGAEASFQAIRSSTWGVIFFATPHAGSDLAEWGELVRRIAGIFKVTNSPLLAALNAQSDDGQLERLRDDFTKMLGPPHEGKLRVLNFRETKPLLAAPLNPAARLVVPLASSHIASEWASNLTVDDADHRTICKFGGPDDPTYKDFKGALRGFLKEIAEKPVADLNRQSNQITLNECLYDLRTTDPRDDKTRIMDTKGGLLTDAYRWILDNSDFQRWRHDRESQLLWIKGDPGKGKTMLLCGIIDELSSTTKLNDPRASALLSYFFCQATDSSINNATAVLRGLIYLLVDQQPSLVEHIQRKYNHARKLLFEDKNAWVALSEILKNILHDPGLKAAYLVIDALDECETGLPQLLDFIVSNSTASSRIKWILSSRNRRDIEERLELAGQKVRLSLELNAESVSAAVEIYIQEKVCQLSKQKKYDDKTKDAVKAHLSSNADGTFLWVALVCQRLKEIHSTKTLTMLRIFPSGLNSLYGKMMEQIDKMEDSDDVDLCKQILAIVATVYRPITLKELTSFIDPPYDIPDAVRWLEEMIGLCGSFLTLRERTVYFVHQSAKDFLLTKTSDKVFLARMEEANYTMFSRSLKVLSGTLQRDIYRLRAPGFPIDKAMPPDQDPLAMARYSCIYWVGHLCDSDKTRQNDDLQDSGAVHTFLKKKYLYWLEALSLLRSMSEGVIAMQNLENVLLVGQPKPSELYSLVHDAKRFILSHMSVIKSTPLQIYSSALLFSPQASIVRNLFQKEIDWVRISSGVEQNWSPNLQTLEGHSDWVRSVVFSPDGSKLASGSDDRTVRVWDVAIGQVERTLEGHSDSVRSVVFSPDGSKLASGSADRIVRVWDVATGQVERTLEGHSDWVWSVVFSPDGSKLASGSDDRIVQVWDVATGQVERTLEGHSDSVRSVVFSPDGSKLASDQPKIIRHHIESRLFYSVDKSEHWVTQDGSRILYLPPDHRPGCIATEGSTLAIGSDAGRVTIITFYSDVKT